MGWLFNYRQGPVFWNIPLNVNVINVSHVLHFLFFLYHEQGFSVGKITEGGHPYLRETNVVRNPRWNPNYPMEYEQGISPVLILHLLPVQ
jgi:hypothetical protein